MNSRRFVVGVFADKHAMDDRNYVKLGGAAGVRDEKTRQYTNLESLPIEKYYLWRDLASEPYKKDFLDFKGGVYYYGAERNRPLLVGRMAGASRGYGDAAEAAREGTAAAVSLPAYDSGRREAGRYQSLRSRATRRIRARSLLDGYLTALSNGEPVLFTVGQRPVGTGEPDRQCFESAHLRE